MPAIKPRLDHLVAVARAGSISKAAEELNISQPALSRSVASFERSYGLRVFDRSRTGVELTPAGHKIVAGAGDLLNAIRDFDLNTRLYASGDVGEIRVGLGPLIASIVVPGLSDQLMASRPGINLQFSTSSIDQLLDQLIADEIDLIFHSATGQVLREDVVADAVGKMRVGLIVRSGHPLAGRSDLATADLSTFRFAHGLGAALGQSFGMQLDLQCDNYHLLREVTLGSDAIWLSSPLMVGEDLAAGRLTEIQVDGGAPMWSDVMLFRRGGRVLSPLARQVVSLVTEMFSAQD